LLKEVEAHGLAYIAAAQPKTPDKRMLIVAGRTKDHGPVGLNQELGQSFS
jgi:hypothetical protein